MLQCRPHAGVELRARPHEDRQGQEPKEAPDDAAVVAAHRHPFAQPRDKVGVAEDHHRDRDDRCEPELPHQAAVLLGLLFGVLIDALFTGSRRRCELVAAVGHRLAEIVKTRLPWLILDVDFRRRDIQIGGDDARGAPQRAFHLADARGAVQAFNGHAQLRGARLEAFLADGPEQLSWASGLGVVVNHGEFLRQVDACLGHARNTAQCDLHALGAMHAGHTVDR